MADRSHIGWTSATWNPMVGCMKVSDGCDHCYAETLVNRFAGSNPAFPNTFDVLTLRPSMLDLPLRWRRPRRVFVNSLSDLFHADVPDDYIAQTFAVMALATQHQFQVLTKRPGPMRSLLSSEAFRDRVDAAMVARGACVETHDVGWPLPNVWGGTSVEDQRWADIRIPLLLDTPLAVRFISAEPLLGPVSLHRYLSRAWGEGAWNTRDVALDWVIVGGESGRGARPMELTWVDDLAHQCREAGTAFFMKQFGSVAARQLGLPGKGDDPDLWPPGWRRQEYPQQTGALR